jgi:uncharacterized membrane protein
MAGRQAEATMMIRSVVLFMHVLGMLVLFIAIAIEWLSLESLRRATTAEHASSWVGLHRVLPRVYGVAFAVLLVSGIYLSAGVGLFAFAWVRLSLLLCAAAIIVPRFGLIKEWAYAGAFFNYSSAVYSHVMVGDGPNKWMAPLVYTVLTTMSWVLRPPERRLVPIIHPQPTRARDWIVWVFVLFLLAVSSLLTLPKGPDGW